MSEKFDTDYLEVGDTFVGGPIEQSAFIGAVMAAGGEVDIHGDTVYIVQLPKKVKAPVSEEPVKASEPVEEPKVEAAPEPTVEEPKVEAAPEPKVEEPKAVDSEVAIAPKPIAKPGPKPKIHEAKAGE